MIWSYVKKKLSTCTSLQYQNTRFISCKETFMRNSFTYSPYRLIKKLWSVEALLKLFITILFYVTKQYIKYISPSRWHGITRAMIHVVTILKQQNVIWYSFPRFKLFPTMWITRNTCDKMISINLHGTMHLIK